MNKSVQSNIKIVGARKHNLNNIDVEIPKNKITVFTGVSGSGKSSLVFGTIAAESQRQLNDTFPPFIRHRLPHYGQPEVDEIDNLSVAIIVDQKRIGGNARSTVGTASDIYTLLRLLFSRVGKPFVGFSNIFSFNHPSGMCPACDGLGSVSAIDIDRLIDQNLSLNEGAIRYSSFAPGSWRWKRYACSGLFDVNKKIADYSRVEKELFMYADNLTPSSPLPGWPKSAKFEGVITRFTRSYLKQETKEAKSEEFKRVVTMQVCPDCHGMRLNANILTSRIEGKNIGEYTMMPIKELKLLVEKLDYPSVRPLLDALKERLDAMCAVGLGYLDLNRTTTSLSGGESQRLKMVRHLGSSLTGMTYIIDEPSTGLHPADIDRLNTLIVKLRNKGNTILMVEHDPDMIAIAEHVIDLGPGAGNKGGNIVFQGGLFSLKQSDTLTGKYIASRAKINQHPKRAKEHVSIKNAVLHNLRNLSVDVPLNVMVVVTGVAGSGKSSLVMGELAPQYPDAIIIDQKPIHTSIRSHIASWCGVFDTIRMRFAQANHVAASWFSANSKGACPECNGLGVIQTDLAFMDTVTLPCDACQEQRYNPQALTYLYQGKTIAEVLSMSVRDAGDFFCDDPQMSLVFSRLIEVGLGYLRLGESLNHLSGGECQRLKLAANLNRDSDMYIFDEPTTGLHPSDVASLVKLFKRLVDRGNSVIIIEHNMELIAQADWIIDIGPYAGQDGGTLQFSGTPGSMLDCLSSLTAEWLRKHCQSGSDEKNNGRDSQSSLATM
ncbi:UvrABC system protein A [Vibrio ruber DSM 16370]|uniref:UvrABC system protein A n=1 Tax=Vibrio ruber (strain DSM 16370 / JCM 11486 / BCRC 17186 / CECT 7878 / LMG 23124 / VR1) TaxID=1123498 RepID=A0A1R4LU11_VIBR1|nr:excinuclease ABC subunit UvrA [Vibrio ruber]SJN60076.1 UvrABC system protein A [Vibrio ruber DSM 16370]